MSLCDLDMFMLNLKASFAILSYIERKYLQHDILLKGDENSEGSECTDADIDDPCDIDDEKYAEDEQSRVNVSMYRMAWQLER